MKRLLLLALFMALPAAAAPPYDVTVTFTPPIVGGIPDGYNFYVDDCFATGALSPPVGSVVSGQTFPALIATDGTFEMCVRAFNAAGENPDPGQVATVVINDLPLPGPVNNLGIQVTCPTSNCTINVTVL